LAAAKVLFVCLGNSCRSQMAEALTRHLAPEVIEASSAGLAPLGYVSAETRAVLAEIGVSSDGQTSKSLRDADLALFDRLVNLSGRSLENLFDGGRPPMEDWDVGDPYGRDLEVYRRIRDEIERRVRDLIVRLRASRAAR
jgi:arsenate reductase (thioredoxin)